MPLRYFHLLIVIFLLTAPLLFVGGPGYGASPSIQAIWNCGHVPFFAVVSLLILHGIRGLGAFKVTTQLATLFLVILASSFVIESLQRWIGRDFDWQDIAYNLAGAVLACFLDHDLRILMSTRQKKLSHATTLVLLALIAITPGRALFNELAARRDFPVLLDLNAQYELLRLDGSASFRIVTLPELTTSPMLEVNFLTSPYSSLGLVYPPKDWSQYQTLQLHFYNPSKQALPLTIKVHDRQHRKNGYRYSDRYNRRLDIGPGWQHISIRLEDIATGPRKRRMDLTDIAGLSLFTRQLPQERSLYIDRIELRQGAFSTN